MTKARDVSNFELSEFGIYLKFVIWVLKFFDMMLNISIITPDKVLYEREAYGVTAPGLNGELTILPGHTALVTPLRAGRVIIRTKARGEFEKGEQDTFELKGGVLEVSQGKDVIILAR